MAFVNGYIILILVYVFFPSSITPAHTCWSNSKEKKNASFLQFKCDLSMKDMHKLNEKSSPSPGSDLTAVSMTGLS